MTDIDPTAEADPAPAQWVHVTVLGGDTHQLDFTPGMTVAQALTSANLRREPGTIVQINGIAVEDDAVIEPNSVVQLTSRVKNG